MIAILKKIQNILFSILQWIISSVLILGVLVLVFTQTNFGKKQILKYAQQIANESLNGKLTIAKLDGNLFTSMSLSDIVLTQHNDTILSMDNLHLNYQLTDILYDKITFNKIDFTNPKINLIQKADSSWNIEKILKPDTTEKDTSSAPFGMIVTVHELNISNGDIHFTAIDSLLPQQIKNIDTRLSATYSTESQQFNLSNFNCEITNPNFTIKNFKAQIKNNINQVTWDLMLKTAKNKLYFIGNYYYDNIQKSQASLTTNAIQLYEFSHWIPAPYLLKIQPKASLSAQIENKILSANFKLETPNQQADLALQSKQLVKKFIENNKVKSTDYKLQLKLSKLDLRDWLNDKSMNYVLNGMINIQAEGNNIDDLVATLHAKLNNSRVTNITIKKLNTDIKYNQGKTSANLIAQGTFGTIILKPNAINSTQKNISYQLSLQTKQLNIAPFMGANYQSDINMNLALKGTGYDPKTMKLKTLLLMNPSKIMSFNIDTVFANINYIKQNIDLKSFFIKTLSSDLRISGNFHQRDTSNMLALLNVYDAREIAALVGVDSVNTSAKLSAKLYGLPNDLKANLLFQLDSSYYKSMKLNSLILNANGLFKNKKITVDGNAVAKKLNASGFELDSINLLASSDLKNHQFTIRAASKDIQTYMKSRLAMAKKIRLDMDSLGVNYKNYNWILKPDSTNLQIENNKYSINNFVLQSKGPDTLQTASLHGKLSMDADENLQFRLQNIYLPQVYALFNNDEKLKGTLSITMNLNGTAAKPELNANYQFKNTSYDNYLLNKFNGHIWFKDNYLETDSRLIALDSANILLQAKLPLGLRLDSMQVDTESFKHYTQSASLSMDSIPLALAKAFYPFNKIDGKAQANLKLSGTPAEPKLNGNFNLNNGLLKLSNLGIDYQNINTNLIFKNRALVLDTLYMNSKKGKINGNGNVLFTSNLLEGEIENANVNLGFVHFKPFDHRQFNMEVDGNIHLKANNDSTRFTGELSIPETMIYLPAVFKLMKKNSLPDIPKSLLAAQLAIDSMQYHHPNSLRNTSDSLVLPKDILSLPPYLSNLQGKIKIKIPRNMWIKNDDMRLELSGDLELIKNLNFFEIFGNIIVVRGQYDLLGKIFILKTGIITFEGGEEMDPRLDMEAHYNFRDTQRESHTIKLFIGGNMYKPEFKFKYDDQDISEGDAISYIVFGASLSALSEIESQSSNAGDLAKMAAASLLSSQLTKLIGNTLNMDFVEYRNSSSFDNASLTVGKYLTNKLFISYEQNLGKLENDDTNRYNLRLEYELMKYLFLELNSSSRSNGLDLIFKLDQNNNPFIKKKKTKTF